MVDPVDRLLPAFLEIHMSSSQKFLATCAVVLSIPMVFAVEPFAAVLMGVGALVVLYLIYGSAGSA